MGKGAWTKILTTMANKTEYINRVAASLQGLDLKGLFPSVIIAQAILESGWGESALTKTYNNHFGMKKGSGTNYGGWGGQTVTLKTGEVINGQRVTINGVFRVYPSLQASIIDHNGLFYTLSRYKAVLTAKTPQEQIQAIKNGGYATATNYVNSVMKVINDNNLTRFDTMLGGGSGTGSGSGTGTGTMPTTQTTTQQTKNFRMNTKTLSIIIIAAGLSLAALGGYNLLF